MMRHVSLALLAVLAPLQPAVAGPTDDLVQLEVLPGWRTEDGTHMAAIRLTLAPGWKTYWRAPGDAGIPPDFAWQGSDNIAGAQFHWPVPEVFDQNGMRSIGYSGQVVLPVEFTPSRAGEGLRMAGEVEIGVCEEICVPVMLAFDTLLPPVGALDPAIAAALVDRPMSATEGGVNAATCSVRPGDGEMWLTASLEMPPAGPDEVVVIEAGDPLVWVSESEVARDGHNLTAKVRMVHVTGGGFAIDRSAVRITVLGPHAAVDILGCDAF
jgi:DsbC/DsbD-like thiol-disulfide interchange protein